MTQMKMVQDLTNVYTETRSYNERLQLTELKVVAPGNATIVREQYVYGAQNNGQIERKKDILSGEDVTYTYDALRRLVKAETPAPGWGMEFGYDGFGNGGGRRFNERHDRHEVRPNLDYARSR
jgi:hypothetical protein